MGNDNLKDMWNKLKTIYSKVSQEVVYSIFQGFFNYPKINKLKKYNKSVIQIFAEVRYLYKRLKTAIILVCDPWNTIAIVIALDTL